MSGPLVRLTSNYGYPLKRLFPDGVGRWGNVTFTTEPISRPDFFVCFNYPKEELKVECPREHCWSIAQEPPHRAFHWLHSFHQGFGRLYSSDTSIRRPGKRLSHPHMHWHVNRSFQWLREAEPPEKTAQLSTITSNQDWLEGHRRRYHFVSELRKTLEFDWFGRGVRPLEDKWDGLAPYRYSLAIENFSSDYYWTEKLIDCFLCWTIPIYYGCPRLDRYFPADSFIPIDITRPKQAAQIVFETIRSDSYEERFEALTQAREKVLQELNPLAFIASEI